MTSVDETTNEPIDRLITALTPPDVDLDYDEGEAWHAFAELEIADLEHATWAAMRLRRLRSRADDVGRVYAQHQALLDQWLAEETRTIMADARFFEGLLRGYHERRLLDDPKHAKTVKMPDGTHLRSQAGKLSVDVVDLEAFERWAEANDLELELLRFPEHGEPNKAEIARRFGAKAAGEDQPGSYPAMAGDGDKTGETVPGVLIVRGERTFTISLADEAETGEPDGA
jgi:hypothetical protein